MWWTIASSPGSIGYTSQKNGQGIWGAWTSDLLLEDTGTSDFELTVIVTDEWHQVSTAVIQVDVDSHARQCFF